MFMISGNILPHLLVIKYIILQTKGSDYEKAVSAGGSLPVQTASSLREVHLLSRSSALKQK